MPKRSEQAYASGINVRHDRPLYYATYSIPRLHSEAASLQTTPAAKASAGLGVPAETCNNVLTTTWVFWMHVQSGYV